MCSFLCGDECTVWLMCACLLRHCRVVEMKERLTTQIRADFDKCFTTGGAGVRCSILVLLVLCVLLSMEVHVFRLTPEMTCVTQLFLFCTLVHCVCACVRACVRVCACVFIPLLSPWLALASHQGQPGSSLLCCGCTWRKSEVRHLWCSMCMHTCVSATSKIGACS